MLLHVWTLAEATVAVVTLPFIIATVCRRDFLLERVSAVECVRKLLAEVVTPG